MLIDVMHTLASALEAPVIVILIVLVVVMAVIVGMLLAELFTEHRYFRLSLPQLIDDLKESSDPAEVIQESGMLARQKNALLEILSHPLASASDRESLAVNLVAEEQAIFDTRVKVTDLISKIAPMLGLMGTLIPLGPGIVSIGSGDTELLSESLLIAFDTTVLGLLVAAVSLCVSAIRKTWYAKYMAAFEAAAECVLEIANERGAASAKPAEEKVQPFTDDSAMEYPQAGQMVMYPPETLMAPPVGQVPPYGGNVSAGQPVGQAIPYGIGAPMMPPSGQMPSSDAAAGMAVAPYAARVDR